MKKNILALTLISLSVLALPVMVFAVVDNPTGAEIGSLGEIVNNIASAMWIIFGGVAVVCFVVAGILFLTAGGAPEKVQTARAAFIWGVAGVVVGIIAYSIIQIVSSVVAP